VEDVLDELEWLVQEKGVKEVSFVDDVFTAIPRRTQALCEGMVQRELGLSWFCNARADQVNARLADAMAAAGCHQVYIGMESGDPEMLKFISKGAKLPTLERGAALLGAAGVKRSVGFVIGLPGETDETVSRSIELAKRVKPERIQFSRWTPLAGSPLVKAGYGRTEGGDAGFHDRLAEDQVSRWLARCYSECWGDGWGKTSV